MADFNPDEYELRDIALEDIDFGDRHREEMGNLTSLANDISQQGVITPIAVVDKEAIDGDIDTHEDLDPDKPFLLAAGERRTRASIKAGESTIPAKIFTHEVDEWQMRIFELHENVYRKSMTPYEEAQAEKQLHELYQRRHGEAKPIEGQDGHGMSDTAEMLDKSKTTVSQDLEIAKWGEEFEEVRNADTKSEARSFIRKKKKELAAEEKQRRVEEEQEKQEETGEVEVEGKDETRKFQNDLAKRFLVGDYFEKINDMPDGSIDILELDPDWGIDFIKRRASRNSLDKDAPYKSVAPEAYQETLQEILQAAWPKLKDHAWVLLWYSIQEWHEATYRTLENVGFNCQKMPAFWVKSTGNTATPAFRLGDSVAAFFYARKGSPRIQNMGRDNTFHYRTLKTNEREHPAEKPVELYQEILNTFGQQGQVVVSGFAGSGNCLLAAENLKMNSVGFDIEEENKSRFKVKVFDEEPGNYSSYES